MVDKHKTAKHNFSKQKSFLFVDKKCSNKWDQVENSLLAKEDKLIRWLLIGFVLKA